MAEKSGYLSYFEILGLDDQANPGEVRKTYKRKMKDLVREIAHVEITEERRTHYLLEIAKLNAAVYVLRDKAKREEYWKQRSELMALEDSWRAADPSDREKSDALRREFDGKVKSFLSKYVEETMLEAGQDKEVVEASNWNPAHARHAIRLLRYYRHRLYHTILERLPYHQVTPPSIDWDERRATVDRLLSVGGG